MQIITRSPSPHAAWALEQAGQPPLLARLFANRGVQTAAELDMGLAHLLAPDGLLGMDAAVGLLLAARAAQRKICIVADYDCDGATACAVLLRGLALLGFEQVDYTVPDRMVDGYGLTPAISERVAATGAAVLLTVDNGIASVAGVARAQALGLQVLITDHHLPAAVLPQAEAILNPNQPGCGFASKNLAGVGVAFYLLLALRKALREAGAFSAQSQPNFGPLLPLVALGTVADVVPLDANNRRLVAHGVALMRQGKMPAGLHALLHIAGKQAAQLSTQDLGFAIGPRINAAGRLADMRVGIECLRTDDAAQAQEWAEALNSFNQERQSLQHEMQEQAMQALAALQAQDAALPPALVLFDEGFHEGVVGIVAARVKDRLHRPTFVFAASGAEGSAHLLKGSGRSIAGFHLRDALDLLAKRAPGVLLRFGGHAMAAGCTLERAQLPAFEAAWQQVAADLLSPEALAQKLLTDGPLRAEEMRLDVYDSLAQQVWGQGFAPPVFSNTARVLEQRLVGQAQNHSKLRLQIDGQEWDAIWFGRADSLPQEVKLAYQLDANEWRNQRKLQLLVQAVEGF